MGHRWRYSTACPPRLLGIEQVPREALTVPIDLVQIDAVKEVLVRLKGRLGPWPKDAEVGEALEMGWGARVFSSASAVDREAEPHLSQPVDIQVAHTTRLYIYWGGTSFMFPTWPWVTIEDLLEEGERDQLSIGL